MTNDEYRILISMVRKFSDAALILSTELDVCARKQTDPRLHSILCRWHRALHDCGLNLQHILVQAPRVIS